MDGLSSRKEVRGILYCWVQTGVIAWFRDNRQNKYATAQQFGIDRKWVQEWLNKEDSIQSYSVGETKKKYKVHIERQLLSAELNDDLAWARIFQEKLFESQSTNNF